MVSVFMKHEIPLIPINLLPFYRKENTWLLVDLQSFGYKSKVVRRAIRANEVKVGAILLSFEFEICRHIVPWAYPLNTLLAGSVSNQSIIDNQ